MSVASQKQKAPAESRQGAASPNSDPQHDNPEFPSTKRDAIIEAAAACFLANGFGATSMDKVAAAAGVAKQTLYHYFGNKNGLFEATLRHVTGQITHVLSDHQPLDRGPAETLRRFGSEVLEITLRPQSVAFMRLLINEAGKHQEVIDSMVRQAIDGISDTLAAYLRRQAENGRLGVDDPKHASRMFLGMLTGELRLRALLGALPDMGPAAREKHLNAAVDAFLRAFST